MSDSHEESPPDLVDATGDTSISATPSTKKVPITIITGKGYMVLGVISDPIRCLCMRTSYYNGEDLPQS